MTVLSSRCAPPSRTAASTNTSCKPPPYRAVLPAMHSVFGLPDSGEWVIGRSLIGRNLIREHKKKVFGHVIKYCRRHHHRHHDRHAAANDWQHWWKEKLLPHAHFGSPRQSIVAKNKPRKRSTCQMNGQKKTDEHGGGEEKDPRWRRRKFFVTEKN